MTDILGPGTGAPNAVTTRVAPYRAFGNLDTWFKDCSTPASQDGTAFQADFFNGVLGQLRTAIRGNGQLASGTGPVVPELGNVDAMLLSAIQLLIARGQPNAGADTGTADALAVAPSTPWPEYVRGARIWVVKSATAGPNATAAPSIAVSGLAAVTIVRRDGSALLPGDLPAGVAFCAEHDGTYFRLVSLTWGEIGGAVQSGKWVYGRDTGAANAAVVTLFPVQAPVDGQEILVKLAYANTTTAPTINVSGFGTKNIMRQGGGAPASGDLQPGYLPLVWDATNGFWRVNGFVASDILALVVNVIAAQQIGVPQPPIIFSTVGTFTYTPSAGTRAYMVEVQGGGGGGGGTNAPGSGGVSMGISGGGASYGRKVYIGNTGGTVVVGAGGAGGNNSAGGTGSNGSNGGTSSYMPSNGGTPVVQPGGGGGANNGTNASFPSGTTTAPGTYGTGGDVNIPGGNGQAGIMQSSGVANVGLAGCSYMGTTPIAYGATHGGANGTGYGSGGTGGLAYGGAAAQTGGSGAQGIVIITEYH